MLRIVRKLQDGSDRFIFVAGKGSVILSARMNVSRQQRKSASGSMVTATLSRGDYMAHAQVMYGAWVDRTLHTSFGAFTEFAA